MLRMSYLLWGILCTSVIFAGSLLAVALIETASGVSNSPTFSLVNTCILQAYGTKRYTVQRPWGALGGAVFALASGVIAGTRVGYTGVMMIFAGAAAFAFLCVGLLPEDNMQYHHQPDTDNDERYVM
ncbi:unnamed protein product [Choristocarpus tenellus]